MPRKRKVDRSPTKIIMLPKTLFIEQVNKVVMGEITTRKGAAKCGVSFNTFTLRMRQYLNPQEYGELPEDFFIDDTPKRKRKKKEVVEEKKITLPDLSRFI